MLNPGEMIDWIRENRYVRDLTADECKLYRIEAFCAAHNMGLPAPTPTNEP